MKRCVRFICLSLFLSFFLFVNVKASSKLNVFVSILPQKYFVEQVGAEHVNVNVMVGPGQSPATYEPTPKQMAALAKADIYFSIGVPFEHAWIEEIKSNNKDLIIIECCKMIAKQYEHDHHHHHDYNSEFDPHIWTSPNKVIQLTGIIQEKLIEIDNKNAKSYKASAEKFKDELNRLDEKIKNKTTHLKKRDLVVTHPSWSYFADQYGFNQLSIEVRGKELQASSMTKLISHVKEKEIRAVFSQPQFSRRAAEVLARETGAKIIDLDPLAFDYIENMNDVVDKIVQGMSL